MLLSSSVSAGAGAQTTISQPATARRPLFIIEHVMLLGEVPPQQLEFPLNSTRDATRGRFADAWRTQRNDVW